MCTCDRLISFPLSILVYAACGLFVQAIQPGHVLYNMKNPKRISAGSCSESSPEIFFHNVAQPSLSLLYLRSKAFFGILMDKIESSITGDSQTRPGNETREQWEFISKTVSTSLDSAIDQTETSWEYFIIIYETQPLPWEKDYKSSILHGDALYQLEYSYTVIDAVIRSGTKEIVGTLQHQMTDLIRKLEDEISKTSKADDPVTEMKLFKQMKQALAGMKSSFTTKLLEKVVGRAMDRYSSSGDDKTLSRQPTFISEVLDPVAILLQAFREKSMYPKFWYEMSKIFAKEFKIDSHTDENEAVINLMRDLSNPDSLINLIVQIISRDNKK